MTNLIAIILGALILIGVFTDWYLTGGTNLLFLARKFTDFTLWLAFWR